MDPLIFSWVGLALFIYGGFVSQFPRRIGTNYMTRWYVIPRNPWFNVYLHRYTGSDDDRALHDHPWRSLSFLLKGEIREHLPHGFFRYITRWPVYRSAEFTHRIEVLTPTAWTLFITGPRIREWGFYCPQGWISRTARTNER